MLPEPPRRRILTWQVHGNYLWYLSQAPHDFFIVTRPGYPPGYGGLGRAIPWRGNVHELPETEVARADVDLVLYQSRSHWNVDRERVLTPAQRRLPSIYLEHDPPLEHPSDTRHWAWGTRLLVHVTPFNALMWDSGEVPTRVIEHGVVPPDAAYDGSRPAGIAVVNHLERRGRRLGLDLYLRARREVPLALAGMGSETLPGGLGELPNPALPRVVAQYRFLFNPIRWTSLGLSMIEAMMAGVPVVALATTEVASVIGPGRGGWADTRLERLIEVMRELLRDPDLARRLGAEARHIAQARFSIERFVADWNAAFHAVATQSP